ncbi:hypothetical protein ACLMJK_001562 [Lecanora helva]
MTSRQLPYINDYLTPTNRNLLINTLEDFLPHRPPTSSTAGNLAIGHHLVYFPPDTKLSSLLPDGTDPLHSPGPAFRRRMWAGGSIVHLAPVPLNLSCHHLREKIVDVQVKGQDSDRKVFVKIERSINRGNHVGDVKTEHGLSIIETRNLVFFPSNRQNLNQTTSQTSPKILKPPLTPDMYHKIVPSAGLLFRFSALTFNAHAIHLDKKYCQEVEGHRNLLVHGPLTVVLMLEVLKGYLSGLSRNQNHDIVEEVHAVEYRNLAPLYAEEEMTICLRRKEEDEQAGSFDLWIVGANGGYAVKGSATTIKHKR